MFGVFAVEQACLDDLLLHGGSTPCFSWVRENRDRFRRKLPLSAFLRLLPAWLLKDAQQPLQSALASPARGRPDMSPAVLLTLCHLSHWSSGPRRSVPVVDLAKCIDPFRASCALEMQRRCGLLRMHTRGEDRLDPHHPGIGALEIELNPLVLQVLKSLRPLPDPETREFADIMADLIPRTMVTDWADPEALHEAVPPPERRSRTFSPTT